MWAIGASAIQEALDTRAHDDALDEYANCKRYGEDWHSHLGGKTVHIVFPPVDPDTMPKVIVTRVGDWERESDNSWIKPYSLTFVPPHTWKLDYLFDMRD